jgi:putative ABC transport system permease protein
LVNRLVLENLKNRPVWTFVSALAIALQVTMVLTLVGISRGMVDDAAQRARGVGADVVIRPPYSSLFSFSGSFPDGILAVAKKTYDVKLAMGVLVYSIGGVDTITGIDQAKFDAMSGGFHYLEGRPLRDANDILVDDYYAPANHLHAGYKYELINRTWTVAAVVEHGKMSRIFASLPALQSLTANTGRLSCIYVKASRPETIKGVMKDLAENLPEYKLYSMDDLVSQ